MRLIICNINNMRNKMPEAITINTAVSGLYILSRMTRLDWRGCVFDSDQFNITFKPVNRKPFRA